MLKGWTTGRLLSWLKWSEGRLKNFVAQRYEPLIRFDSTPVYDVTLAEDTTATSSNPFIITAEQLGGHYRALSIFSFMAAVSNAPASTRAALSVLAYRYSDSNVSVEIRATNALYNDADRYNVLRVYPFFGTLVGRGNGGVNGNNAPSCEIYPVGSFQPFIYTAEDYISALKIYTTYVPGYFASGSKITIYAAL